MDLNQTVKKAFRKYTKKQYPKEADQIIQKAEELFPVYYAKAPYIGGKENRMAYNLDLMIWAVSYYEASDHRIDGPAILSMANKLAEKYKFLRILFNLNRKWQMKIFQSLMYKTYIPYSKLVEEKVSRGEWNNTWRIKINPRNTKEGICFDFVGCPLADYAKANGYEELLPYLCATDHIIPGLFHAKLIRTHTCATGASSCDYWYVADKSAAAKEYAEVEMK